MKLFEMEGFLRGKCLPADMLVNETNSEYLARKISGLQAQVKQLAAENAALKKFCKTAAFYEDYEAELGMERGGFADALNDIKTPATDASLASLRAEGVEMFANHQQMKYDNLVSSGKILTDTGFSHYLSGEASTFAAQLRSKSEVQHD